VLWRASSLITPREIATALIADKAAPATRKQFMDLTAATHSALWKRDDVTAIGRKVEVGGRLTAIFPPLSLFGAIFPSGRHFE
jgi:hypothetical protein